MNRRSFISSILAGCVAPMLLPGAGRKWTQKGSFLVPKSNWVFTMDDLKMAKQDIGWGWVVTEFPVKLNPDGERQTTLEELYRLHGNVIPCRRYYLNKIGGPRVSTA